MYERPERPELAAGAVLACLAVLCGAFGAHALKPYLDAEAVGWWTTAVQYQMWHALAVVAIGLSGRPWARLPGLLFILGSIIFSATLYAMALGGPRWLGAITPLGGLTLIAAWALLAWRALASRRSQSPGGLERGGRRPKGN